MQLNSLLHLLGKSGEARQSGHRQPDAGTDAASPFGTFLSSALSKFSGRSSIGSSAAADEAVDEASAKTHSDTQNTTEASLSEDVLINPATTAGQAPVVVEDVPVDAGLTDRSDSVEMESADKVIGGESGERLVSAENANVVAGEEASAAPKVGGGDVPGSESASAVGREIAGAASAREADTTGGTAVGLDADTPGREHATAAGRKNTGLADTETTGVAGRETAGAAGTENTRVAGRETAGTAATENTQAAGGETAEAAGTENTRATGGESAGAAGTENTRAAGRETAGAAGTENTRAAGTEPASAAGRETASAAVAKNASPAVGPDAGVFDGENAVAAGGENTAAAGRANPGVTGRETANQAGNGVAAGNAEPTTGTDARHSAQIDSAPPEGGRGGHTSADPGRTTTGASAPTETVQGDLSASPDAQPPHASPEPGTGRASGADATAAEQKGRPADSVSRPVAPDAQTERSPNLAEAPRSGDVQVESDAPDSSTSTPRPVATDTPASATPPRAAAEPTPTRPADARPTAPLPDAPGDATRRPVGATNAATPESTTAFAGPAGEKATEAATPLPSGASTEPLAGREPASETTARPTGGPEQAAPDALTSAEIRKGLRIDAPSSYGLPEAETSAQEESAPTTALPRPSAGREQIFDAPASSPFSRNAARSGQPHAVTNPAGTEFAPADPAGPKPQPATTFFEAPPKPDGTAQAQNGELLGALASETPDEAPRGRTDASGNSFSSPEKAAVGTGASTGRDAGGDSDSSSRQRNGAARASQAPEPLKTTEGAELPDAPATEAVSPEASALDEIPEFDVIAQEAPAETDAIPIHDRPRPLEASAVPRPTGAAPAERPVYSSAWIRNMLQQSARTFSLEDGWKVMEMQLEEGSGTMTVKTRRDENRVSVSVGFTDPGLRTMVMANVDRLQQTLQAHYQSDVDLSLLSGGNGGAGDQNGQQEQQRFGGSAAEASVMQAADIARNARALMSGATNEWIG